METVATATARHRLKPPLLRRLVELGAATTAVTLPAAFVLGIVLWLAAVGEWAGVGFVVGVLGFGALTYVVASELGQPPEQREKWGNVS